MTGTERQSYGIQILTAPTADTPGTSVALTFGRKRYLFGHLSEGTQRSLIQRSYGMRKLRNIFLTGITNWQTNGGLLGFILTIADVQAGERETDDSDRRPPIHIHSGPKLLHTLAAARRFIFRTGMPLTITESTCEASAWPSEPSYTDENIRVWSIPVKNASSDSANVSTPVTNPEVQREQDMRAKIVRDMFDSEWRRDRLIETPFKDVKMPAMVFIRDPETKELKGTHCPTHESASHIQPSQIVLVRNPWPASLVGSLPPASGLATDVSMSYVVRGHQQRGTFDPKKAIALGAKPGPIFSELTAGRSITLENGNIVTPEMVLGPQRISKGIAVFDLPSPEHFSYFKNLLSEAPPSSLDDIATVVWILGPGVAATEEFKNLLKSLDKLQHIVSDADTAPNKLSFESAALATTRLAKINPINFSVPVHSKDQYLDQSRRFVSSGVNVLPVQPGLKINLEPKYAIVSDEVPELDLDKLETLELPESIVKMQQPPRSSDLPPGDALTEPELITLGTGSAMPSKYRNVSATLVRLPHKQGNFLLDCGENTLGQLRRTFPADELQEVLRNLQGIWISHLHADHHLGTISVLQARAKAFDALGPEGRTADRTIYLMSEQNMIDFVREYSSVEPSLLSSSGYVPLVCTPQEGPTLDSQPFDLAASSSSLQRIETVKVSHCAGAQAVSLTFKSGFKVSYSGDCRPSYNFCRVGLDSDVLIHEATFDDEMQGDAIAKKHSTTAEALGIAVKMRAKNVLLTHFSQRYSKIPNLSNVKAADEIQYEEGNASQDAEPIEGVDGAPSVDEASRPAARAKKPAPLLRSLASNLPIAIAFDFMRIKVSEIAAAKQYYPAIQVMFELHEALNEERREEARKAQESVAKTKTAKKQGWQLEKEKGTGKKAKKGEKKEEGGMPTKANGERPSSFRPGRNGPIVETTQKNPQTPSHKRTVASSQGSRDASPSSSPPAAVTTMSKRALKKAAKRAATEQILGDFAKKRKATATTAAAAAAAAAAAGDAGAAGDANGEPSSGSGTAASLDAPGNKGRGESGPQRTL
ncbi:uncharacterized protein HMPREF1541_00487 [Cyphellophora europaea CBS 101466]|uniref:ribonuclease Z n=1 Tax=Cyphellophora europaea (strain CBS 101466) TaxID=1220924 RepID=W2SE29_CYPE1|nr:uncharacterized protein HMPREF1541_00487 [Cyphellophora europaea CBS 101466]ETN46303.1 hypothetical protein HMPREF1541_00487 [Cyphellophora europaea CBS 101466]